MQLINRAALDSGLDLTTLAPEPAGFDDVTGLSTIVLSISAIGTYNEVTEFSYQIESLPRAAKITRWRCRRAARPTRSGTRC